VAFSTRVCEWPFGDPREPGFRFCGKRTDAGRPYCAVHCRKAYRKVYEVSPEERERRAAQAKKNARQRYGMAAG
jgi:GcrA cell cycle regulator